MKGAAERGTAQMGRMETSGLNVPKNEELGIVLIEELDGAWRREVKEDSVERGSVHPRKVTPP